MKLNGIDVLREEREILADLQQDEEIAFDFETSGLNPQTEKIAVITTYGMTSGKVGVLHLRGRKVPKGYKDILEDKTRRITWHNGVAFDIPFAMAAGVDATKSRIYDTIVGAGVAITSDRAGQGKSLQAEIERRFNVTIDKKANHSSWMNPELNDEQILYCGEDILHLHALRSSQEEKVAGYRATSALELEMAIVPSTSRMIHNGLPICVPKLDEYKFKRAQDLEHYRGELYQRFPEMDNIGSHMQVRAALKSLGMKIPGKMDWKTRTWKETTQADVLGAVQQRGVAGLITNGYVTMLEGETAETFTHRCETIITTLDQILRARECKKTGDSYSDEWLEKWTVEKPALGVATRAVKGIRWVHPKFRSTGTDTLRFSSAEPNFQQWPKVMRGVIGGVIMSAGSELSEDEEMDIVSSDYSQIEVVIAAYQANDPVLLPMIEAGGDIHRMVASQVFSISPDSVSDFQRRVAKACSFCLLFGGEAPTLMDYALQYGAVIDLRMAQDIVTQFFQRFPGVARVKAEAQAMANSGRNLIEIRLASGGVRHLTGAKIKPTVILNTNVQGNAAVGMKYAILEARRAGLDKYLAATVHDELVAVVPKKWSHQYAEALEKCMITGMNKVIGCTVRVESKIAPFWS